IDAVDVAADGIDPRGRMRNVRARAGLKVARRRLLAEGLMRPDLVVFGPKDAERLLKAGQVARHAPPAEPFAERAMKALDFPLRLRVPDAAVQQANALLEQKDTEGRQAGRIAGRPPRRAVIAEQHVRHAILLETRD